MCSAGDGDSERDALNKKLDDVAAARARGLNDAIEDEEVAKAMAAEAAKKRIEELKARAMDQPQVGGSATVERASKLDPMTAAAPSFLGKSVESAAAANKEAEAAADQRALRRAEFFEGVEIDPRGFIVPQVGDIVLCPGKWANEDMVALVEDTQFVDARMSWNIDVIELSQVGPQVYGRSFSAWRKPVKRWFDVSEVRPARAEYVDEQDAWRVDNARVFDMTDMAVNETARSEGLQEYETLKTKIFLETAGVGLVGSVGCGAYDPAYGTSFALGALASLSYIALLARQVEDVGPGKASDAGLPIFSPRFAAPAALAVALYLKFSNADYPLQANGVPLVPPAEIACAVVGFLAYKIPLLYESSRQIAATMDDTGDALTSGMDEGYKQWQVRVKDNVREARERESNPSTSINPFTKIRLTVEQQYRDKADAEEKERLRAEREAQDAQGRGD